MNWDVFEQFDRLRRLQGDMLGKRAYIRDRSAVT